MQQDTVYRRLKMPKFEIYVDGASKGNPGPSGIGVIIYRDTKVIKNISVYIGETTNNVAEYTALIHGLHELKNLRADNITVKTDSQLMHRQLTKVYQVKDPKIIELNVRVWQLITGFKEVYINYIPRQENSGADKLATQAVKIELARQKVAAPQDAGRKVRAPGVSVAGNSRPDCLFRKAV